MMREIIINGTRSWNDLGALLANVDEQYPEILDVIETVPYSGVEYNFTSLYGSNVYSYRDVIYTFKLWHNDPAILEQRINTFVNFMYGLGDDLEIYDSGTTYHYTGRLASFEKESTIGEEYGARKFKCTFRCKTKKAPNAETSFTPDADWWPDVNDDNAVTASDAALILIAAASIGATGELPPGWTAQMAKRADANHDGTISASDAALVQIFAAECGAGLHENNYIEWYKFLNARMGNDTEVI